MDRRPEEKKPCPYCNYYNMEESDPFYGVGETGFICKKCKKVVCYRHSRDTFSDYDSPDLSWRNRHCTCGGQLWPINPKKFIKMEQQRKELSWERKRK